MLVLTALTPMVSDDYAYCFSWEDWTRIKHIGQIIPSMAAHRNVTNGRVIVHGLVQLLLLLPRPLFCILNALNAVLLFVLIRRLLQIPKWKPELSLLLFGAFSFCCFLPAFGENVLWLDGSLNYFWGLSCSLLFLSPFLSDFIGLPRNENVVYSLLRVLLAFVFGTWSENTSLVFLFLACCFYLLEWIRSRRFRPVPLIWLVTALAGYIFLMTAPATSGRAGAQSVSVIGYNIRVIFSAAKEYLLILLLIYAVLFALSVSFQVEKRLLVASVLLFIGALLAHFSYVFAAYFVPRHLCTAVFLLVLSSVLLLAGLCRAGYSVFSGTALTCISILFLLLFPVGVLDVAVSFHKQHLREEIINTALASDQRSVILENYYPYTSFAVPFELNPIDPSVGPNINIAEYYGLDEVLGMESPAAG